MKQTLTNEARIMSHKRTSDDYNMYSKASSSCGTGADSHDLESHQIREYDVVKHKHAVKRQKVDPKGAMCDSRECVIGSSGKIALYLCYVCNLFMCGECMLKHDKTHDSVSIISETGERRRMAEIFVKSVRSRGLMSGEAFDKENVRVYGQINVKHELDKRDCYISGFSGLVNKRWVAVDRNNKCIKMFCSISNTLLRYIKFGSVPQDVTEITIQQNTSDPNSGAGSGSETDQPGTILNTHEQLLAVTFPLISQIWFIDVNKTPAVKVKLIEMEKECRSIDFSEDKIFILCWESLKRNYHHSIYILSSEGNKLKVIQNPDLCSGSVADLAVHEGLIYVTDFFNNKVFCVNIEDGETVSQLALVESGSVGISVDNINGVLYVCGPIHNKVYKLFTDLREYEPLGVATVYTQRPHMLCFIKNKLFISHYLDQPSSLDNVVTVVHLVA